MMPPVWPAVNYLAQDGSWSLTLSDGLSRKSSDMDDGSKRLRRRFSRVGSTAAFTVEMGSSEIKVFEYFYAVTLLDGTYWFTMPIYDGETYVPCLVRFKADSSPVATDAGYRRQRVTFNLELRDLPQLDQATYQYLATLGSAARKLSSAVYEFVNLEYPSITSDYR